MSIKLKMLLWIGFFSILSYTIILSFIAYHSFENSKKESFALAEIKAKESAFISKSYLQSASEAAKSLSNNILTLKNQNNINRNYYLGLLKNTIDFNKNFLSVWIMFEKNKIDNRDSLYLNTNIYDKQGRFNTGLVRYKTGIAYEYIEGNATDEYLESFYTEPMQTKSEIITDPYMYAYGTQNIVKDSFFETSIVIPVIENNQAIGVVGIDIEFAELQNINSNIKIYQTGYGMLISQNGFYVSHPNSKMAGIQLTDTISIGKIKNNVSFNKTGFDTYLNKEVIYTFQPFTVGNSTTPWAYCMVVPIDEVLSNTKSMLSNIIIIGIIGIIIICLVVFWVSIKISQPIEKCINYTNAIAKGNLFIKIETNANDELGKMILSLNTMTEKISKIIKKINLYACELEQSSEEIKQGSEQLSDSSNSQTAAVEEILSTIDEMTSKIEQSRFSASENSKFSKETTQSLRMFAQASIKGIDTSTIITEKINIINEIAFQTNFLALNAAVEAARAGNYGKGFELVALEIRKLAEKSKNAAIEISVLSKQSIIANKESKILMDNMIPKIDKSIKFINEIEETSEEQLIAIEQISITIQKLNQIVHQNVSFAEEVNSKAYEFAQKARFLRDSVEYFKTKNSN
jgi:methyl-accepting chemotaxis protein